MAGGDYYYYRDPEYLSRSERIRKYKNKSGLPRTPQCWHTTSNNLSSFSFEQIPFVSIHLHRLRSLVLPLKRCISHRSSHSSSSPSLFSFSYIHFTFQDTNTGIQLTTTCSRFILPGQTSAKLADSAGYTCANNSVLFRYSGAEFFIERSYIDPR